MNKINPVGELLKSAVDHLSKNNFSEAEELCLQMQKISPNNPEVINILGVVALHRGELDKAYKYVKRSLDIDRGNYASNANFAIILSSRGELDEAIKYYKKALSLNPQNALLHVNFGSLFMKKAAYEEAITHFEAALKIDPFNARAWNSMGMWAQETGDIENAVTFFKNAFNYNRSDMYSFSNMLIAMHYRTNFTKAEIFNASLKWAEIFAPPQLTQNKHERDYTPGRKIRLGYVSADFRDHPVVYFLLKVLENFNDNEFEVFCYANNSITKMPVKITDRKINWYSILGMSDSKAALLIDSHKIDILFDLSGHTSFHRLGVFARKPAPVQITWIGYYNTTGLKQIDYIIADRELLNEGDEKFYTEKFAFMPERSSCYKAPDYDVTPAVRPARKNGFITFGCFNYVAKISPENIELWAKILNNVPDAKLFFKSKGFGCDFVVKKFKESLTQFGIGADRLIFEGHSEKKEYFASYGAIDIALDPFPYNGGTSTLDALWMGVPIITLKGDSLLSRIGTTCLKSVGLTEFIANSSQEYIDKAVKLAGNIEKLESTSESLRERLKNSATFNYAKFTTDFENLLKSIWQKHVEKQENTE